ILLQGDAVIVVEVVQSHHVIPPIKESTGEMKTNKASCSGNQNFHKTIRRRHPEHGTGTAPDVFERDYRPTVARGPAFPATLPPFANREALSALLTGAVASSVKFECDLFRLDRVSPF